MRVELVVMYMLGCFMEVKKVELGMGALGAFPVFNANHTAKSSSL